MDALFPVSSGVALTSVDASSLPLHICLGCGVLLPDHSCNPTWTDVPCLIWSLSVPSFVDTLLPPLCTCPDHRAPMPDYPCCPVWTGVLLPAMPAEWLKRPPAFSMPFRTVPPLDN